MTPDSANPPTYRLLPPALRDALIYEEFEQPADPSDPQVYAVLEAAILEHMHRILILLHPLMAANRYGDSADLTAREQVARTTYSAVHNAEKHWLRTLGRQT